MSDDIKSGSIRMPAAQNVTVVAASGVALATSHLVAITYTA